MKITIQAEREMDGVRYINSCATVQASNIKNDDNQLMVEVTAPTGQVFKVVLAELICALDTVAENYENRQRTRNMLND
jgi:hypothetical protein